MNKLTCIVELILTNRLTVLNYLSDLMTDMHLLLTSDEFGFFIILIQLLHSSILSQV